MSWIKQTNNLSLNNQNVKKTRLLEAMPLCVHSKLHRIFLISVLK
jgi:hypothetical protein